MLFFPFCAKNNATLMQTGSSYLTYSTVVIEKDFFRLVTSVGQTVVSCSGKLDTSGFSQVYLAK